MDVLERFIELVDRLKSTSGRIEKENILTEYKDDEEVKYILNFIFNPYIITGISKKKASKYSCQNVIDIFYTGKDINISFIDYLKTFENNHSGKDQDLIYLERYAQNWCKNDKEYQMIYSIVTKDLTLGVQPTTLNKIFGKDFIPTFNCMLAERYFENPEKLLPEGIEFILTTKLDGVRCICFNNENGPEFFSRQGQIFQGLIELEEEIKSLPKSYVYDGELLLDKNGLDSKDLYRQTMKVVGSDKIKQNIIFNVFDKLPIEDFKLGECETRCKIRKQSLKDDLVSANAKHIKNVDILYEGTDQLEVINWLNKITNEGGEGVMINLAYAPYECKRSKCLLKVKKFQSCDVRVIDLEEGTGSNKDSLGAIKVEFLGPDNKKYTCKVGSGFKQDERKYFWKNKDKILNHIVEIGYFEITNNQQNDNYSLRFPTFKWLRDDKDEISMY